MDACIETAFFIGSLRIVKEFVNHLAKNYRFYVTI